MIMFMTYMSMNIINRDNAIYSRRLLICITQFVDYVIKYDDTYRHVTYKRRQVNCPMSSDLLFNDFSIYCTSS